MTADRGRPRPGLGVADGLTDSAIRRPQRRRASTGIEPRRLRQGRHADRLRPMWSDWSAELVAKVAPGDRSRARRTARRRPRARPGIRPDRAGRAALGHAHGPPARPHRRHAARGRARRPRRPRRPSPTQLGPARSRGAGASADGPRARCSATCGPAGMRVGSGDVGRSRPDRGHPGRARRSTRSWTRSSAPTTGCRSSPPRRRAPPVPAARRRPGADGDDRRLAGRPRDGSRGRGGLVIGVLSGVGVHDELEPFADVIVSSIADLLP